MPEPTAAGRPSSAGPHFGSWEQAVAWIRAQQAHQTLVIDAYYDDPLVDAATRYWRSEEWQALRARLPEQRGAALDVGAGRGIASFALAKEGFRVTALEPDGSALVGAEAIRGLARQTGLPVEVTQEFSERLPFADASFDLVFARAVLHHTADLKAACREFHRVLKPGGRLLAIREHVISKPEDLPAFLDIHPLHKLYGGENAFLLNEYRNAIEAAGLHLGTVLAPFDSAINFAPHTLQSLRSEIAARACGGNAALRSALAGVLSVRPVWALARRALNRVDRRPGRLYSFVADRS